ncbi:hypothetical protein GCM10027427_34080 [Pseudoclavibacter terrae]
MNIEKHSVVVDPDTQVELLVPSYSTPAETILRAQHQRDGALVCIRVYPEHATDWPLWASGDKDLANPDTLGISDSLVESLRAWQHEWSQQVGPGLGWTSEESMSDWVRRGDILCDALIRELWTRAVVLPEYQHQHIREADQH